MNRSQIEYFICTVCKRKFKKQQDQKEHLQRRHNIESNQILQQKSQNGEEIDLSKSGLNQINLNKMINNENINSIKYLNLSHNELKSLNGIEYLSCTLITLKVSYNKINSLENLRNFQILENLHASNNQIKSIEPISQLHQLKIVDISNNQLENYQDAITCISELNNLLQLSIFGNKCFDMLNNYKLLILAKNQQLQTIDDEQVEKEEYQMVNEISQRKQDRPKSSPTKKISNFTERFKQNIDEIQVFSNAYLIEKVKKQYPQIKNKNQSQKVVAELQNELMKKKEIYKKNKQQLSQLKEAEMDLTIRFEEYLEQQKVQNGLRFYEEQIQENQEKFQIIQKYQKNIEEGSENLQILKEKLEENLNQILFCSKYH